VLVFSFEFVRGAWPNLADFLDMGAPAERVSDQQHKEKTFQFHEDAHERFASAELAAVLAADQRRLDWCSCEEFDRLRKRKDPEALTVMAEIPRAVDAWWC
jgi:hypothetical protein